jgi:large subunit ribosomal protein L4
MAKEETTKKTIKKVAVKPVKKEAVKKAAVEKKQEAPVITESVQSNVAGSVKADKQYASISINVVGIDGKVTGKISLPGEMFGEKLNKALIAQAVRVYLANQRQGTASTKTRGEVDGSTRKIYRQKGTGRARHGSVRAPIFVKGGIVFGPKPRDFSLSLPQKMKRKALFIALSAKVADNELTVIDGLASIEPKTKNFAKMLTDLGMIEKKKTVLFVTSGDAASILRAGRNVPSVHFIPSQLLNTYEVLGAYKIIVMKDAIAEMRKHFFKK